MRKFLLVGMLLLSVCDSWAQNWNTVRLNDTVYFANDWMGKKRLKTIWIESFTTSGSDTTFSFYKSYRDTNGQQCLDTMAASWLGKKYIHQQDGTEYYFNSKNDTTTILTQAQVGDSWTIAQSGNKVYKATLNSIYWVFIDSAWDMVKKLSIQANVNGNPVSDWYNGKEMIFSNRHGWLQTFDLYCFPNTIQYMPPYGTTVDSVAHIRIDKSFNAINLKEDRPFNRYVAGNEWIFTLVSETDQFWSGHCVAVFHTQDSVINVQNFPNKIVAFLKTERVSLLPNGTKQDEINYHYDTITTPPLFYLTDSILPEYNWGLKDITDNYYNENLYSREYYVDKFCSSNYNIIKIQTTNNILVRDTNGCITFYNPPPTFQSKNYRQLKYLDGFGIVFDSLNSLDETATTYIGTNQLVYLKLNNCVYGTKYNVHTLGIEEAPTPLLSLSPNPVADILTISLESRAQSVEGRVEVLDVFGRVVYQQSQILNLKSQIDCSSWPSGLYLVHCTMQDGSVVSGKVVKE
jgi:hypothetical protein